MKPSLQVRLSQHLALTPQLQQSIRLLQLSTLELQQEVDQMLEENPFLEEDDDDGRDGHEAPMSASASADRDEGDGEGDAALAEVNGNDFGTTEREDWENGTEREDFDGISEAPATRVGQGEDDQIEARESAAGALSLQEHLSRQLAGVRLGHEDRAAIQVLIESLDLDGYLADPLEEIAERLCAMLERDGDQALGEMLQRLQIALCLLQSLEPTGVGARALAECLCLQLRTRADCPARAVAISIATHHLELLAKRDIKRLVLATGADEDLIRDAQAMIVGCEPKPGRPFTNAESNIIIPDVIVQRAGRGFKVSLNPDVMPKLRINNLYAQAMRGQRGGAASGLTGRLQEARWFMKNILQRFDTILRVSQAIVERQKNFFTHGDIAMKPLVLREIADELGLHESTISRVTTAKYMATPQGTFELKYFFGSSLNTEAGGNASSTAVRALLQQLVEAEDPAKPLSDSQLSHMLEEQGIQVARRTVAKYRDALKIAPATLRKTL